MCISFACVPLLTVNVNNNLYLEHFFLFLCSSPGVNVWFEMFSFIRKRIVFYRPCYIFYWHEKCTPCLKCVFRVVHLLQQTRRSLSERGRDREQVNYLVNPVHHLYNGHLNVIIIITCTKNVFNMQKRKGEEMRIMKFYMQHTFLFIVNADSACLLLWFISRYKYSHFPFRLILY